MKIIRKGKPAIRIAAMTIFAFMLLLTGCGGEMAESEEPPVESTDESIEQTVSVNIEETETTDISEETPGRFQYDEKLLYFEQPVVTEEEALAEGKTLLILQTSLPNTWLKDVIAGFNRQSENYFIRREETNEAGDEERMFTEIMAGRGPDIFTGDMLDINESILKKGVLMDLAPGLDAIGITDEEYFPSFQALRMGDAVYGMRCDLVPDGISIRKSVLGDEEQPDIETLVEKLYTYPDQEAVWWDGARSERILEYLLSGSEDLWGMIDWEKGTCDFSGELFAKILEIAKRYADPERKALDAEEKWLVSSYRPMWNPQKQLESKGYVIINYLFDDGNYPAYTRFGNTLLINANTKYQEGIWEFIKYFLGEEGQCYATEGNDVLPSREMTRNAFAHDLKLLEEGRMQTSSEYTPEAIEELYAFTEQGRSIPLRPKEVLDIIYEEAQSFCNGDKPLEDVCNVIQKRVQIYISESM